MKIKKPLINYTSRDFASIKEDLLTYAQKYYPETYRDFNESSFGSLMVDMVSYIGDILSFYVDYQANESFLNTAIETDSVIKLSRELGYKFRPNAASHGEASFFVSIPARTDAAAPDYTYAPILKRGTTVGTSDNKIFTLINDLDFAESDDVVVAAASADGTTPTRYAIKTTGLVMSGELMQETFDIGNYQKFLRIEIEDPNLTEVVAVYDADGNNYYEVDYLTQDTVYVPVVNTKENKDTVESILKPISVPRRFITEQTFDRTVLQFGSGTGDNVQRQLDPTDVILDIFGKNYITDKAFDPTILTQTDKMGVPPTNTVLTVIYRRNTAETVNVNAAGINRVITPLYKFLNEGTLTGIKISAVRNSLEVVNEEPITGDVSEMSTEEIKMRGYGAYGAQNRAVTKQDYINMIYNMPSNFGQVKKAKVERDTDSFNGKNLNLYVISTDSLGILTETNSTIKQNLKTWISKYKMIGDTIDILNASVQNLQIQFTVIANTNSNKFDVLQSCLSTLSRYYGGRYFEIGEPFPITDVYKLLNNLPSVTDVKDVTVNPIGGGAYSGFTLPYNQLISNAGRYLVPPSDVIFEIRYPSTDINGEVL